VAGQKSVVERSLFAELRVGLEVDNMKKGGMAIESRTYINRVFLQL
jgi:hypothetical protein